MRSIRHAWRRPPGPIPQPRGRTTRILLLRYAAAGDLLQAADLIRDLRAGLPAPEIYLACAPDLIPAAELLPGVRVLSLANPYGPRASLLLSALKLRVYRADIAISLHPGRRMALLGSLATRGRSLDFSPGGLPWPQPAGGELRQTFREAARAIGVPPSIEGDLLRSPGLEAEERATRLIAQIPGGGPLVLIATGGGGASISGFRRRWPPEHFGRLAGGLLDRGARVALVGLADDPAPPAFSTGAADWRGSTTADELSLLVERADLVITNDSLPAVLSGLHGTRSIVLAGPTLAEQNRAGGDAATILRSDQCSPCWLDAPPTEPCPHAQVCMTALPWEDVLEASLRALPTLESLDT
ncbi:MAG: hypothetical protein CME06_04170 [Gemmatimonadetes bacterium]|nr:hypothetical protein [Gemmatimonadota bacterium]